MSDRFTEAQERVKALSKRPDNKTLLELYALFKQGSAGDVAGKRPGMMDLKGRAKYDAWAGKKGLSKDDARDQYIALVKKLEGQ
jgi:acyl-CoA-binding protein